MHVCPDLYSPRPESQSRPPPWPPAGSVLTPSNPSGVGLAGVSARSPPSSLFVNPLPLPCSPDTCAAGHFPRCVVTDEPGAESAISCVSSERERDTLLHSSASHCLPILKNRSVGSSSLLSLVLVQLSGTPGWPTPTPRTPFCKLGVCFMS